MKSKAQQFDFSKLFTALDDLENAIKVRRDEEIADFKKDEVQYYTDVDFFNGQITQFGNEVVSLHSKLDSNPRDRHHRFH